MSRPRHRPLPTAVPAQEVNTAHARWCGPGERANAGIKNAAQLDRPLSTVRRRVRAVRDPDHVEWLRARGVEWLALVDRDVLGGLRPEATRLGEALTAPAAAAVILRVRVAPRVPAWTLIGQITHGPLLAPPLRVAPG